MVKRKNNDWLFVKSSPNWDRALSEDWGIENPWDLVEWQPTNVYEPIKVCEWEGCVSKLNSVSAKRGKYCIIHRAKAVREGKKTK